MDEYPVNLEALPGHPVQDLLVGLGKWVAQQEYGTLGYFELVNENPVSGDADIDARLQRDGFSFMHLPDGSQLLLISPGNESPLAVCLLGSEGETKTVADSLEEFLLLWSQGKTGIDELDDSEVDRKKLQSWIKKQDVTVPTTRPFDFNFYLAGEPQTGFAPPIATGEPTVQRAGESLFDELVRLVGRRADDPELVSFMVDKLHAKPLRSTTERHESVSGKALGIELSFSVEVNNRKYPTIQSTKNSYVPYLTAAILYQEFPEPLPFGLQRDMPSEQLDRILGERWLPVDWGTLEPGQLAGNWDRVLDEPRDVAIHWNRDPKGRNQVSLHVMDAISIGRGKSPHIVGVFVSWAIMRNLIDESSLADQLELVELIRQRERRGSELFQPDDFWDIYLKKDRGLRQFASSYFDKSIFDDFVTVFGERGKRQAFHVELDLDNDGWEQVDRAARILDQRFAQWTGAQTLEEFICEQLRSGRAVKEIASDCAAKYSITGSDAFKLALSLKSKSGSG